MISSEGPSPLGTRTAYNNNTFLNFRDSDWGQIDAYMNYFPQEHMNLTQWYVAAVCRTDLRLVPCCGWAFCIC